MMKLIVLSTAFAAGAVFAAAVDPTTVMVSGDWSNPITWGYSEGTEIATTATEVDFNASGLSLNADVDARISTINLAGLNNVYSLSASEGKTLTVAHYNSAMIGGLVRTVNIGSLANNGKVVFASLAENNSFSTTVLNVDGGSVQFNDLGVFNGSMTIDNGASVSLGSSGNATFNASGSKLTINNGTFSAGNSVNGYLNLASHGTMNVLAGIRILRTTSIVDGTLNISGNGIAGTNITGDDGVVYNTRNFMFRFGNGTNDTYISDASKIMTFGVNANVVQVSINSSRINDLLVNTTVLSQKNSLRFQNECILPV